MAIVDNTTEKSNDDAPDIDKMFVDFCKREPEYWCIGDIKPSLENDTIYQPPDPNDPSFQELVASVKKFGILEPILISIDRFIISGHRRYAAAIAAGLLEVPRYEVSVRHDDPIFLRLLREHNRQRTKTFDERLREEIVSVDSADACARLKEYRAAKLDHGQVLGQSIEGGMYKGRCAISPAKMLMLATIIRIIAACKEFWPLSDRQIHYRLLNDPPLIHASKPGSDYKNNLASYRALTDLLTRARLAGHIPWDAIADETRSFTEWDVWTESGAFVGQQVGQFLKNYWRDLMQSQPAHIEIVAEKLTVKSIVERVARDFTIPVTIARGFCSIQPRYTLAERFKTSGRDRLTLLFLSDLDPEGESIAESFTRSLRDDFQIGEEHIHAIKVALTPEQVERFRLPRAMKAKQTSSRFKSFREKHGGDDDVWELEALPPETLAAELRSAINSVIDVKAFEHEREQEAKDAQRLEATRAAMLKALPGLIGGGQ